MKSKKVDYLIKRLDTAKCQFAIRPKVVNLEDFEKLTFIYQDHHPVKENLKYTGVGTLTLGLAIMGGALIFGTGLLVSSIFTPSEMEAETTPVTSIITSECVGAGFAVIGAALSVGAQISIEKGTKKEENIAILPEIEY